MEEILIFFTVWASKYMEQKFQKNYKNKCFKKKFPMLVGTADNLPFKDKFFQYIVASHSCYYLNEDCSFNDNLKEISRILNTNGFFICTIPQTSNYYIIRSKKLKGNEYLIKMTI